MLPGIELMGCAGLAAPADVMHHVVRIESSFNPYAIGVVGARLARQPRSLPEAVSTERMLESKGYNFSLGLAQVNRHNLASQGLDTFEKAFDACPNLQAGSRILASCYRRAEQDWGKALSCYYSGNFVTGFRHGYVQKVLVSWRGGEGIAAPDAIRPKGGRIDDPAAAAADVPGSSSIVQRRAAASVQLPGRVVQLPSGMFLPGPETVGAGSGSHAVPQETGARVPLPEAAENVAGVPVTVQSMSAARAARVPGAQPAVAGQPMSSGRDEAFVF